jgi:hypothetical protein
MFSVVVPGLNVVVPKFKLLNQLPEVIVAILAPVVNVRFAAFDVVPPVVPYVKVLVTLIAATVNPPGPLSENPVRSAICNTVVNAVVCVRLMFPAVVLPNAIERVAVLLEVNIPVFNVTPSARIRLPEARLYVPVTVID